MISLLERFGADKKEARTFLTLLELGAQPISVLAKHMSVPRSSMYVTVDKLKELQLVEELRRGNITYVRCVSIDSLQDILRAKQRGLAQTQTEFEEKIDMFRSKENKLSITPTVRFFEGKKAVMSLYEEVLKAKEFRAMFNPAAVKPLMPEYCYFVAEELKRNKGSARELLAWSREALKYQATFQSEKHEIKILPKNAKFEADIIICTNTLYMISYNEKEITGTKIENQTLAMAQTALFDELWDKNEAAKS